MLIRFTQSGGFAGLVKSGEFDDASLPADEASALKELVASSGWRELKSPLAQPFPDAQTYEIEIRRDALLKRFMFQDGAIPKSFEPLIDWLKSHASYEKK